MALLTGKLEIVGQLRTTNSCMRESGPLFPRRRRRRSSSRRSLSALACAVLSCCALCVCAAVSGHNLPDIRFMSSMNPAVTVSLGGVRHASNDHRGGGKNPRVRLTQSKQSSRALPPQKLQRIWLERSSAAAVLRVVCDPALTACSVL